MKSIFIVSFLFLSAYLGYSQKIPSQKFYIISPDGLATISIDGDTITTKKCFPLTDYTDLQSKSLIVDLYDQQGYYFISCKTLYKKYSSEKDTDNQVLVFKHNNNMLVSGLPVTKVVNLNSTAFTDARPDLDFLFTAYSKDVLDKFAKLREIGSLNSSELKKIVADYNEEVLNEMEKIKKVIVLDPTGSLIARELLNRVLIKKGVNPNISEDMLFKYIGKFLK